MHYQIAAGEFGNVKRLLRRRPLARRVLKEARGEIARRFGDDAQVVLSSPFGGDELQLMLRFPAERQDAPEMSRRLKAFRLDWLRWRQVDIDRTDAPFWIAAEVSIVDWW